MIEIDFNCPDCDVELTVEETDVGDSLDCPSCGSVLEIEWDGPAPPPSPDAEKTVSGTKSAVGSKTSIGKTSGGSKKSGGKKKTKLKMGKRRLPPKA